MTTRIIIENKTKYRTRDLRRFAVRAIKGYYDRSVLRIEFRNARRGQSGCAYLNSYACVVRLPAAHGKVLVDKVDLAMVIAHEAAHCAGITHVQMNQSHRELQRMGNARSRFDWANDLDLELATPPSAKKLKGYDLAEEKHRRAVTNLARWEKKQKYTDNKVKAYRRKIRYYEKRMVAIQAADERTQ